MAFGPAILDRDILPDDIAGALEAVRQTGDIEFVGCGRPGADKPDHRHRVLLCPRRKRPCSCCPAEKRDELAALHSITSSARPSNMAGTVSPMAFAAFRL